MNLPQFKQLIDRIYSTTINPDEVIVGIKMEVPRSVGGTPISNIQSVFKGSDWDNRKLIIVPEDEFRHIDPNQLTRAREELENLGWTAYEFNNLKRENKRLLKLLEKLDDT